MPSDSHRALQPASTRVALSRGVAFFALWFILLPSVKPGDLLVGTFSAVVATWASFRLLPPAAGRVRFAALAALLPRFLWQSLIAGIDVARRAFAASVPLRTGFVDYPTRFPRGQARNHFATIMSLMPGTVPSGDSPETIEFHCLDTTQPIVEQISNEERLLSKAFLPGERDG